jgi:hypothetical protein
MTFNISEVQATQTLTYTPALYLEYCEEQQQEPTEDGFLSYIKPDIDEDFGGYFGTVLIRYQDDHS